MFGFDRQDGSVSLQLSAKSVGLFEAFYSNLKPIQLVHYEVEVQKSGKLYRRCCLIVFNLFVTISLILY